MTAAVEIKNIVIEETNRKSSDIYCVQNINILLVNKASTHTHTHSPPLFTAPNIVSLHNLWRRQESEQKSEEEEGEEVETETVCK